MGMKNVLLSTILLGFAIYQASCTRCYSCYHHDDSSIIAEDNNPACAAPIDTTKIQALECGRYTICAKASGSLNGKLFTTRGCSVVKNVNNTAELCINISNVPGMKLQHCSICDTNLCNGDIGDEMLTTTDITTTTTATITTPTTTTIATASPPPPNSSNKFFGTIFAYISALIIFISIN
ncbi:uncharacterized protein LOC129807958 [Phlebotomus papatasi]|uniref:Protein sleepless n=1 Tax=Phlebotomus papatasi TaxID=29031 RepID=A0A1B0D6Z9_PHLPP|nr:uncharacterized protein LOC129807958 [Phlebotomus papatasi]